MKFQDFQKNDSKVADVLKREYILETIKTLRCSTSLMTRPAALEIIRLYGKNPFLILVSCILSLRTRDTVSLPASIRLFHLAQTPEQLRAVPVEIVAHVIYPVGFSHQKASQLHALCNQLITHFNGIVPSTKDELLGLTGVGPKTANLVLGNAFDIPALCVDTHVHRISNRLGWVTTTTPEQTERELEKIVPRELWVELNHLLVMWGQNKCFPLVPYCSACPVKQFCLQKNVKKQR